MSCSLARSLSRMSLLAWCCYMALRIVGAHPALHGSPEGHDLAPAIHSSHENFVAPYDDHHGANHGELVNYKRRRESQQERFGPQSPPDLDVGHDYLDVQPEDDISSTHVAKRPMMVKDGHSATPIPQSLSPGSDTSSPPGAATYEGSRPSGLRVQAQPAGHQSYHLKSSVFPSTSSASLHLETRKPGDDLIDDSQGLATGRSSLAPSTGTSSEQINKNHRSVHTSTEWDPELAAINIPEASKDCDLLKKIMRDFNHRARGKLAVNWLHQVKIPRDDLNNLPVAFFQVPQSPLYLIKVLCNSEYPKSDKSLASQNSPKKILKQFYRLIHWLLFINTAVLRRLRAPGSMSEKSAEANSNGRLIGWFFQETFQPSNSWPVVGTITHQVAHARGTTFGPIQQIIITCLSSPSSLKRELQTAVLLASQYYEYRFPRILKVLGSGGLVDFKPLIKNAIESKMTIGNGFNKDKWIEKLGNFPVCSLQNIPEALQPSSFHRNVFLKHKVKPGTQEDLIRKYIQERILQYRTNFNIMELYRVGFNPEDYPVLILIRRHNVAGSKQGMAWPRDPTIDNPLCKKELNYKLEKFLDHLNVSFSQLMAFKEHKGIQPGNEMESLFFSWLQKILFNQGPGKLPLLGHFNLEEGRRVDSFSAQSFNEIQALVLNLISDPNSHSRNFQTALSVLGYWLKNEQGALYNQLFKNDGDYWENLTQLIKSELD